MKWLIIGTGKISEKFVRGLKSNNEEPYAVFSRKAETGKLFANANQVKHVFDDLQEALANVDAVYIGTPNTVHFAQAKKALEFKKHVIVEKPMTESFEKTNQLFELAKINNVRLMESYAHINHPKYTELEFKDGDIVEANFERLSSKYKKDATTFTWLFQKSMFGGVVPDIGVYPLSLLVYHFGKVEKITLENKEYYNDVLAKVVLKIEFKNNQTICKLSKIDTGNDYLIINGEKQDFDSHGGFIENRFHHEVLNFINNKNLDKIKNVSLEVARVLDLINSEIFK